MQRILFQYLIALTISTSFMGNEVSAQTDTLKVMTYNLMYYRETTSFCTNSNNDPTAKDGYMQTIIDHVLPDIFVANEVGGGNGSLNSFRLLSNALNQNGRSYYDFANATGSGQNLVNMLYFNSDKLELYNQATVEKDLNNIDLIRVIDIYTLYHKETNLAQHQDTTFIYVIAAHLKAGSSNADEQERAKATEALMAYLDNNNIDGNLLFMGDLNLYDSNEPAYQDLINYSQIQHRFYDPVNAPGNWGNAGYAILHTQSTRTSGGCFSGGGMDDRFDFILASDEIMNETQRVKYLSNTYNVLGQDGNRYNGSLISPSNSSEPSNVINALYGMSDHLPVTLDLKVSPPLSSSVYENLEKVKVTFQNPTKGQLSLKFGKNKQLINQIEVKDISGAVIKKWEYKGEVVFERNIKELPNGVYFLYFRSRTGNQQVEKLIKI